MRNGWDDERLLAALGEALKASQAVPSWFVETGKNAFAWHNIDAELAQLTYDSDEDRREAAAMRSETASIRSLTFTSSHLSLELEVTENTLLGQILPPRSGTLEIHTKAGDDQDDRGGRDRLLRGRSHPGQSVPIALPLGGRHRRANRVGHDLSSRVPVAPRYSGCGVSNRHDGPP